LERAVDFYTLLLGSKPTKMKTDYAKFETDDPSVNLSLTTGGPGHGSSGAHYGIQVKSTDAVAAAKARFSEAGVDIRSEYETVCCYALQDKFWVHDPDGTEWEIFVVLEDANVFRFETSACCGTEDAGSSC
jgi:lactoylglutathione lyase